jgi:hypothetical protein
VVNGTVTPLVVIRAGDDVDREVEVVTGTLNPVEEDRP